MLHYTDPEFFVGDRVFVNALTADGTLHGLPRHSSHMAPAAHRLGWTLHSLRVIDGLDEGSFVLNLCGTRAHRTSPNPRTPHLTRNRIMVVKAQRPRYRHLHLESRSAHLSRPLREAPRRGLRCPRLGAVLLEVRVHLRTPSRPPQGGFFYFKDTHTNG